MRCQSVFNLLTQLFILTCLIGNLLVLSDGQPRFANGVLHLALGFLLELGSLVRVLYVLKLLSVVLVDFLHRHVGLKDRKSTRLNSVTWPSRMPSSA